jgi:hypothetical protein
MPEKDLRVLLLKYSQDPFAQLTLEDRRVYEAHKNIFFRAFGLNKGTLHWIFIDALEALIKYNFLASTICFLAAIEASLRSLLAAYDAGIF